MGRVPRSTAGRCDLELAGRGVHRLALQKAEAGQEAVARVVVELYCERMELAL